MKVSRYSTEVGGLTPRVIEILSSDFPNPLFNVNYELRHPLGIYNISLRHILYAFAKVLTALEEAQEYMKTTKNYDPERLIELSIQQRILLYFLMEHLDDCENIIKCFFETENKFKESTIWKKFQTKTKPYRKHMGIAVGHIKHKRGEISTIVAYDDTCIVPGYFIESVGKDGAIEPYQNLHKYSGSAISFARDLRFHFAWIYILSEFLCEAILEITEQDEPKITAESDTRSFDFYRIAQRIIQIPPIFFREEENLDIPQIELRSLNDSVELFIAYPGELATPSHKRSGKTFAYVIWIGDGISSSYRHP